MDNLIAPQRTVVTVRRVVLRQGAVVIRGPAEFVAKGFEEPVRVYEVRWRE